MMNEYIYIGKFVNTHGIRGELRILSVFEYKEKVFKKGMNIYVGEQKELLTISSYRPHKAFDMILLEGFTDINEVLKYKGLKIFVKRESMNLDKPYLIQDLVGMNVYCDDKYIGMIKDIMYNNANTLLSINGEKNFLIPNVEYYIKAVDVKKNQVEVENIEGLMV